MVMRAIDGEEKKQIFNNVKSAAGKKMQEVNENGICG